MVFAIAPFFQSCKPSLPSDVLSEGKMEEILYDYHLTQAAAETERLSSSDMYAYRLAVLRKHEVTQAQFDSSMVYYTRHTELLQKVYENLYDRLNKEAVSLGATVTELEKFGEQSAKAIPPISGMVHVLWCFPRLTPLIITLSPWRLIPASTKETVSCWSLIRSFSCRMACAMVSPCWRYNSPTIA